MYGAGIAFTSEYNKKICNGKYIATIRCHCIKRIALLLNMIDKNLNYINNSYKFDNMVMRMIYDTFGDNYGIIQILNDYIHIIKYHNDILQDIYEFINLSSCKLSQCQYIKRNYTNRNRITRIQNDKY